MNMKKVYIKPRLETVIINLESHLLEGSPDKGEDNFGDPNNPSWGAPGRVF